MDYSGNNGFYIIDGGVYQNNKTAWVEFIRPFNVNPDSSLVLEGDLENSLILEGGQQFRLWLTWGIFSDGLDTD